MNKMKLSIYGKTIYPTNASITSFNEKYVRIESSNFIGTVNKKSIIDYGDQVISVKSSLTADEVESELESKSKPKPKPKPKPKDNDNANVEDKN